MANRRIELFEFINWMCDSARVDSVEYEFTTLAHERQVADDLAKQYDMRKGEGFIVVFDVESGEVINKLDLAP